MQNFLKFFNLSELFAFLQANSNFLAKALIVGFAAFAVGYFIGMVAFHAWEAFDPEYAHLVFVGSLLLALLLLGSTILLIVTLGLAYGLTMCGLALIIAGGEVLAKFVRAWLDNGHEVAGGIAAIPMGAQN